MSGANTTKPHCRLGQWGFSVDADECRNNVQGRFDGLAFRIEEARGAGKIERALPRLRDA